MNIKKIIIASDHAGFNLKSQLFQYLQEKYKKNILTIDAGCYSEEKVDYPDIAKQAINLFYQEKANLIILVCGTGIGMSIAANKQKGIRCALVYDIYTAEMARKHNHANCLALAGRIENPIPITDILDSFLATQEEEGRHTQRINKIMELENEK